MRFHLHFEVDGSGSPVMENLAIANAIFTTWNSAYKGTVLGNTENVLIIMLPCKTGDWERHSMLRDTQAWREREELQKSLRSAQLNCLFYRLISYRLYQLNYQTSVVLNAKCGMKMFDKGRLNDHKFSSTTIADKNVSSFSPEVPGVPCIVPMMDYTRGYSPSWGGIDWKRGTFFRLDIYIKWD